MTYRKKPQKYDIIWRRKLRHKWKQIERQYYRQKLEYMYAWGPRYLRKSSWEEFYRYMRSHRRVEKKYQALRRKFEK